MRVSMSRTCERAHSNLEEKLWAVACYAKQADPAIKLMGLQVSLRQSRRSDWFEGHAWPSEQTLVKRCKPWQILTHPAGKITLSIGSALPQPDLVRLFAHELRHIGNFHRGRQIFGFLTDQHMPDKDVEPDCLEFEEQILCMMSPVRHYQKRG